MMTACENSSEIFTLTLISILFAANRIQVSEDCQRVLRNIGGFTLVRRGELLLKVRHFILAN